MRRMILIAAGGSIGAVLRYLTGKAYASGILGTLTVNIAGCFMLSLILSIALKRFNMSDNIKLGISAGLLGALTTFSTLCREVSQLIYEAHYIEAMLYATVSFLLGIAAVYLGALASKRFAAGKPVIDKDIPAQKCRESEDA